MKMRIRDESESESMTSGSTGGSCRRRRAVLPDFDATAPERPSAIAWTEALICGYLVEGLHTKGFQMSEVGQQVLV